MRENDGAPMTLGQLASAVTPSHHPTAVIAGLPLVILGVGTDGYVEVVAAHQITRFAPTATARPVTDPRAHLALVEQAVDDLNQMRRRALAALPRP